MDSRATLIALLRGEPIALAAAEWDALVPVAAAQGVLGLLADRFLTEARDVTRQALAAQRLGQMRVLTLQQEILAALPCPVVLLKGPMLSDRLYGDPFQRASRDLDILIDPANLEIAIAALGQIGFTETEPNSAAYLRAHHHHVTLARAHTPPVELHFRLIVGFGIAMPATDFLERAQPCGRTMVLAPEDEFLYLAVHAAQHLCNRLIWLEDLRRLQAQHPDLDWSVIRQRASRYRVRRALEFTLTALASDSLSTSLLSRLEKANLPEPISELISQTALCDSPGLALGFFTHHTGRMLRRRWSRWFPRLAPRSWPA